MRIKYMIVSFFNTVVTAGKTQRIVW